MHGTTDTRGTLHGTTGTSVIDPIFVSVIEAAVVLGLSRREIYRLMDDDEIESVERGRRRLVVVDSLLEYAARLRREAAQRKGEK